MKNIIRTISVLAGLAVCTAVSAQDTFKVKVEGDIMSLGASIMEAERLEGHRVIQDVLYAQPGVKPLKYDMFIPDGASHAFFDWKPDQRTKDTFAKYGVPYAADMMRFFDEVFYK